MNGTNDKERVEAAPAQAVETKRSPLLDLLGECEWNPSFDYKAERSRDRAAQDENRA